MQFIEEEPIGEERDDLRIGTLAATIWNVNLDTKKSGVVKADRYVTGWGKDKVYRTLLIGHEDENRKEIGVSSSDNSLNNPAVWSEAKAAVRMMFSSGK